MTHLRIDSLFAGVTLGYLYHFKRQWFNKFTGTESAVAAAVFCSPPFFFGFLTPQMQGIGLTSMFVGFALLVAWSIDKKPQTKIGAAIASALATVGFYSYSIYLWHFLLAQIFQALVMSAGKFWFYMALSLALGIVMAKAIEMPALALREKWFPEQRSAPALKPSPASTSSRAIAARC
jgi:peptidoglycan/LPS O-acetylase OafA/YrhL